MASFGHKNILDSLICQITKRLLVKVNNKINHKVFNGKKENYVNPIVKKSLINTCHKKTK